jgi:F1F0 ATPase subunit 2
MDDVLGMGIASLAGALAGGIYFAGLWVTLRRLASSPRPWLLMTTSLLVRAAALLGLFWLVSAGRGPRLLACLVGFTLARLAADRWAREGKEAGHAAQS